MNDRAELFVDSRSRLGEGPFWHPHRQRLFWFDILGQELLGADTDGTITDRFQFDRPVSAAGIIDPNTLAIAAAGAFLRLDLNSGAITHLAPLEEDKPGNRSNDGRVNPMGGFWIGTMSRGGGSKQPGAGAVYQYRNGQLEQLFGNINTPNSICFSPDGSTAYFTDTGTHRILKCRLDLDFGRPAREWTTFAEIDRGGPDGSVVDSEGYLWNARWGGSCVVRHAPDGSVDRVIDLPVSQVTCPAFGGEDLRTLYITSARENLSPEQLEKEPHAGSVFVIRVDVPGQPEATLAL